MTDTNLLSLNERVTALTESFSISFADRVRKLKASGQTIIGLQTGDPDFDTPAPIIDAATRAMQAGQTHYADSRGLLALREAIAGRMANVHGAHYDPQTEVLATHGAIQAYYAALQAILNPGDNVLVPDPSWQTHANMVRLLGGTVTRIPSSPESGWMPTIDAWEAAITPQTTTIVLNTPNNPTGAVASRDYLMALNDLAAKHNLYVVSDEVYDSLLYEGNQHVSAATLPGAKERTLVVNSLSKTYAM
ncbi:MAG: aminotransferase class I/II-fold pyridoxal phosphate-dependent enzyme, partial [Burkholderiales bacterium]|nr:aminotransferase class I/II-fold pyridoxal phosphate-dependent enzyme [Anaerolineae bacterium]